MKHFTERRDKHRRLDGLARGFSLIELIVVMAIISLLVALTLPAVTKARQAAKRVECQNNLRNVALALVNVAETTGRFPACGNYGRDPFDGRTLRHHSWVVDALPWLEQANVSDKWDKDKPLRDPVNAALARTHIPVLVCPMDISVSKRGPHRGDLSYVVNGGIGFTIEYGEGRHDCPVTPGGPPVDLNGNAVICPQGSNLTDDGDPSDRDLFLRMGLFFNETWKWDVTVRHHRIATVMDGMSQTFLVSENVRTGYDPARPGESWASPSPFQTSFYIGNPCPSGICAPGTVDYSLCNSGSNAINSGLREPEGGSPRPNSFHDGGVNMAFCDGRVVFLSQHVDGAVYAALASPAGMLLEGTPLEQGVVSDSSY